MQQNYKHIELFAGCGGMSLGLNAAGFKLYMANEISPMAGETYAFNILGEDLQKLADRKEKSNKTLWLKSHFPSDNLADRLRENPFQFNGGKYSDINSKTEISNKLIIGDIDELLIFLTQNKSICRKLRAQNIDLLSGGPPCQGFSLAGKREKDDSKNILPLSFASFAGLIRPKIVILENVKGITSPFKTDDGINHFAWLEIAKAFSLKGYIPICLMLNSKYYSIPQNRPRFILLGFRRDIFDKLRERKSNIPEINALLTNSWNFFNKVRKYRKSLNKIKTKDILLIDIETNQNFFDGTLLPKLHSKNKNGFISAQTAIEDILLPNQMYKLDKIKSEYSNHLSEIFRPSYQIYSQILQNHEPRSHGYEVQARFRLFQILNEMNGVQKSSSKDLESSLLDEDFLRKVYDGFQESKLISKSGNTSFTFNSGDLKTFKDFVQKIKSKKHSQRAIKKNEPAPAQMTIPDDLCHYASTQLRTLTVREMARFQSFPDWFVFRSKVTTGGQLRKFEVPQYTQVGNAVPPLLSYELGIVIKNILLTI